MNILKRREPISHRDLAEWEAYLEAMLVPAAPRPAFTSDLKRRLLSMPLPEKRTPFQRFMLVAAGISSGVFLVVTGIQIIVTLVGMFGLVRGVRYQIQNKPPNLLPPVL